MGQDAFLRLYKRREFPEDALSWLVSVAHNLLRDQSRRRSRWLQLVVRRRGELPLGEAPTAPDLLVEAEEERAFVRKALDRLPLKSRQVLLLRAEGLRYKEIASALDMPLASVGKTLLRAKTSLKEELRRDSHASDR